MRFGTLAAAFTIAGLALATTAAAHVVHVGVAEFVHPWVAPAKTGATTDVRVDIRNNGDYAMEIYDVSSEFAEDVEIIKNGRTVDDLIVGSGEDNVLRDVRFRLERVSADIVEGRTIPLVMRLRGQGPVKVVVTVGYQNDVTGHASD